MMMMNYTAEIPANRQMVIDVPEGFSSDAVSVLLYDAPRDVLPRSVKLGGAQPWRSFHGLFNADVRDIERLLENMRTGPGLENTIDYRQGHDCAHESAINCRQGHEGAVESAAEALDNLFGCCKDSGDTLDAYMERHWKDNDLERAGEPNLE
jgi:hypothetical protein